MDERTEDTRELTAFFYYVIVTVIGMAIAGGLILYGMRSIDTERTTREKEAGIETVDVGSATYKLYTKQDIVYKKGWFGKLDQVISPETGKPMTVEEFTGENSTAAGDLLLPVFLHFTCDIPLYH